MKRSPKQEEQKNFCYTHYLNPSSELHPEFVRFDYNAGKQEFSYDSHRHTDHELIYVEEGFYKAVLNGKKVTLGPGMILLVCPNDIHYDKARQDLKYYSLSFFIRSSLLHDSSIHLLNKELNPEERIFKSDFTFILDIMKEAAETMSSNKPGAAQLAHILLHELFWRFVQTVPANYYSSDFAQFSTNSSFGMTFYRTLEKNLGTSLELKHLAKKLAVSPSQLNKLCHRHLNASPARLVMDYKTSKAKELLAKSDLSIREISEKLNFKDQFTFSRTFKKQTQQTPRDFRKKFEDEL